MKKTITDNDRMDFLDRVFGHRPNAWVLLRGSTTGRGMRLHHSDDAERSELCKRSKPYAEGQTVRETIDRAMKGGFEAT